MTRFDSPRVLFLGTTYAGHATRFANLRANVESDDRVASSFSSVTGWREGGAFERMTVLPRAVRGRMRAVAEASTFARLPRPDVIWLSAPEVAALYAWAQLGSWKRPVVLDLDATPQQLDDMAHAYFGRPGKRGFRRLAAHLNERLLRPSILAYTPWSHWAATGLRDAGVPDEKIQIIPPGVDLSRWAVPVRTSSEAGSPLRILFVGNNFVRKGGDLLVELLQSPWGQQFHLDVVSGEDVVVDAPNIRLHRVAANTPELRALFTQAEIFALPTRAECFGIAAVEAMASGLPVIMGNVGGAADIVDHGVTGWLIEPTSGHLRDALHHVLATRDQLSNIGARARLAAEAKFNGAANDDRVIDLLLDLHSRRVQDRAGARRAQALEP